jgi:hypothetical protein
MGLVNSAEHASAPIVWNELVNINYWSLNLVGARFGNKSLALSTQLAIVDSGTSYLLLPKSKHNILALCTTR